MDLRNPSPEFYRPGLTQPTVKINFDNFYNESIKRDRVRVQNTKYTNIEIISPEDMLTWDYNTIDEKYLYETLKVKYGEILHRIIDNKDYRFLQLMMNGKFLSVFSQAVMSSKLEYQEILSIGKIIYDYSILPQDRDEYIYGLFLNLARNIHSTTISKLSTCNLPESISVDLCIARYSSSDENINVRRLNSRIIQYDANIMTEQIIVDIYQAMFTSISALFISTMYDVIPEVELNGISESAGLVYSTTSLAVLDLLKVMPSSDIRKVLINYINSYGINQYYTFTRFSLRCLSMDYARIVQVADYLEMTEGFKLP